MLPWTALCSMLYAAFSSDAIGHTCMVSYIAKPAVTAPPGELIYKLICKGTAAVYSMHVRMVVAMKSTAS